MRTNISVPQKVWSLGESAIETGDMYSIILTDTLGTSSSAPVDINFLTPSVGYIHLVLAGYANQTCAVKIYEGATNSAAGSALTPFNHNRNSTKTSTATVTYLPTVTTRGTELGSGGMLALTGKEGAEGLSSLADFTGKLILKPNTNYNIGVWNLSGTAGRACLMLDWYEC